MPIRVEKLSYANNTVPARSSLTLYYVRLPWNLAPGYDLPLGVSSYNIGVKTKISYQNNTDVRLEAEHYFMSNIYINNLPFPPYYDLSYEIIPNGSSTNASGTLLQEQYNLGASQSYYYAHLQYPDDANVFNYFLYYVEVISSGSDISKGDMILRFKVESPNYDGKLIAKTELYYYYGI